ncbi:MAG TPA: hypothetical protein VGC13_24425 [Longimicrobium sp.]|jgi:hypothetical protein|uniref:hypothetical protein n=1 Tax=Longimicrobium sp. TaxID=2029185 RepID=UPI002ED9D7AA
MIQIPPALPATERAALWRAHAEILRSYGAEHIAAVLEACAAQLDADERARPHSVVTLDRAVELTGFTRGHLRRLCRSGKLPNVGTKAAPAFRLADLPRKPGAAAPADDEVPQYRNTDAPVSRMDIVRKVIYGGSNGAE